LSVNGTGPPYEIEFIGTAFLVGKGMVLTNRHVVQPWIDDTTASMIRNQGYQPRLKELYTYFPKVNQPFALKQIEVDRAHDLALCSFTYKDEPLPVLPLDEAGEGAVSGQAVVLIGYPAGIEGLLARVDADNRLGLGNRRNIPLQQVLNELAQRTEVRPQSTQGHIGDVSSARIVYDAQTGEGGSGGPVFGANGKVVAVNQAILLPTLNSYQVWN
jgi:S1-C subfamily serine protease